MVFSTGIGSFILTKSKYFLIRSPTLSSFLYISLIIYPFYKIITLDSKENERSISVVRDRVYIDNSSDNRRNSIYKIMATLGLINSPLAIIIHKNNPLVIPTSILMAFTTVGSGIAVATVASEENVDLVQYQAPLVCSLSGLIIVNILNYYLAGAAGGALYSLRSEYLMSIGLFTLLSATDTQAVSKSYDDCNLDKYGHALNIGLTLANLTQKWALLLNNKNESNNNNKNKNKNN